MKFTSAFVAFTVASGVFAAPVKRAPTDDEILNYALTLEHLEDSFYKEGLAKFDDHAFEAAGFPPIVRKRFLEVAEHEATHVTFLEQALGDKAVKPCEYSFPYNDVSSFAALAMALEGVGTSAYLGAAQFITNKDFLTAAASVLATEARHASWISSAIQKSPFNGPFETPLSLNEVFSLAAAFIKSCPSTNPPLPVKAFPALTVKTTSPTPGSEIEVSFDSSYSNAQKFFLSFYSGLTKTTVELNSEHKAVIPQGLTGTVYVVATSSEDVTDETTVAGPSILYFSY
ncbi:hypothetical protein FRC03_010824 [Tulasnella sp. 419]|nr:hypothetical protein FRC03_010824 [Tulasnella sp. 419]